MGKCLLISVHDVTPLFDKELDSFYGELKKRKINKFTLFVTPNWEGKYPINKSPEFITKLLALRRNGAELALHGYHHDRKEFLNRNQQSMILGTSVDSFKSAFKLPPTGYLPVRWILTNSLKCLLRKNKFRYTESFTTLEYFSGRKFKGFPLGMESVVSNKYFKYDRTSHLFSRAFSQIYARFVWSKEGVVRYTIHPREKLNGNFNATLKLIDGFLERGWKPMTYSEIETKI
ncbi:DUF2334 domain-containing protein [Candidatus Woesearchaeota archaeon]|nr:DUF2334 domain-containing protein [Candidatus Woesearchaeota archaeon]